MQRLWEREGAVGGRAVVSWAGVALARQARMARLGKRLAGKCGEEGELRQAARHNGYWAGGMGVEGGGSVEAAGWGSGSSVGGLSQPQETKKVEKATGWAGAGVERLFAAGAAVTLPAPPAQQQQQQQHAVAPVMCPVPEWALPTCLHTYTSLDGSGLDTASAGLTTGWHPLPARVEPAAESTRLVKSSAAAVAAAAVAAAAALVPSIQASKHALGLVCVAADTMPGFTCAPTPGPHSLLQMSWLQKAQSTQTSQPGCTPAHKSPSLQTPSTEDPLSSTDVPSALSLAACRAHALDLMMAAQRSTHTTARAPPASHQRATALPTVLPTALRGRRGCVAHKNRRHPPARAQPNSDANRCRQRAPLHRLLSCPSSGRAVPMRHAIHPRSAP
ncbi:hypothetical protein GRF29_216g902996 [Pseudopithomyces chartarum]|uniref:Uncharacterized protein n=1 Tax=Pseudopithomyces chartarum TaxID=1892770 RepID=A0AAN6LML7_9PLEO|nr:hypothetical protein GRF29_216g902996 [Pseudopithomyces chartarum]